MTVLTTIPNGASNRDIRDTINALIARVAALEKAGIPVATPAPTFTTQPSINPTSGTAGTTFFAATPGTVSNGSVISRVWLLNGQAISNGVTALPNASGTLTYQETASGPGGTATSTIQVASVAAAAATPTPAPSFTSQPSISPSSGTAGATTFTATAGAVSNGSVTSRAWTINGTVISTGLTASPAQSGTLSYQETATGQGGSTLSTVIQVTVATAAAPAPTFTAQPSISPSSGTADATTFTATPGTVSNGNISSRAWSLNGSVISTGLTAAPTAAGTLTYQETATGAGGTTQSTVRSVTVSAAAATPAPAFTAQPSVSPSSAAAGATFTATPGTVSNGSIASRVWSLNGTTISTGLTATPASSGTLTYQETATGSNGTAKSAVISVTVSAAAAGADFTMTQLAAPNRVYQRQTLTGGSPGKGTGTIPVLVTVAALGTPRFRIRAADGTILQASTALPAFTATGAQTLAVTGVEARTGWFYVDLSADGTNWQNGTVLVGMGRLVAMSGQSQAVRQFGKMPSYSGTNASLGVSIDPNSAVYARYSDSSRSVTAPAWAIPADASSYDSTFAAEFLRRQVADRGVNCAIVGHAVGATAISTWQPGQTNNVDLRAVLDAVGGFEAFYWHQGGDDAGAGTSAADYQSRLSAVFGDLASHNVARGSSFERYVTTMATRTSSGAGSIASVQTIRKAALDWAAANNASYLEPHDVTLEDAVHQGQAGNITLARHLHRATTAATDQGPTIVSGTRSGAAITLTTSAAVALVGSPTDRFSIFASGTSTNALAIASLSVSGTKITVTLSADPGSTALDVYWLRHPDPSGSTAAANMIYDTYSADGIAVGRQLQPTLSGAVAIAGVTATPTPSPTPTPTPTSSVMKDTFTAADGTAINGRALDTGQVWSAKSGTWTASGNQIRADGSGVIMVNAEVSSPNYDVEADLTFLNSGSNAQNAFLIGHGSQDGANRFQAGFYGSLGRIWSIGPVSNNGYSNKTDVPMSSVTDNVTYHVKLQFRLDTSTNKVTTTLVVDGVTLGSYVGDAGTYTGAGYAGIRQSGSTTPTDTSGTRWDNFTVTPV